MANEARPDVVVLVQRIVIVGCERLVVLLDEGIFSFDNEGRCTSRYRLVYRILTPAGMDEWDTIAAGWAPWYEERPILRARVVTPDGAEHHLSPETISDSPAEESSPDMFNDRRVLRAPLPALTVGAVVEQEIVIREKAPFFEGGSIHTFSFGRAVRTLKTRLILESPTGLPLRHVVRLLPEIAGVPTTGNGRSRLTFESGVIEPLKPTEPGMPGDVPRWPVVSFTSGRSWAQVAAHYGDIVDRRIGKSDLTALVREIVGDATDRETIVARLLARLRRDIRYTGTEFGNASIVPHTPEETLKRKYGDCKDQSALLIKMLRTAGVPAYMALIRNGTGEDVEPDLPGLGGFNHAIVFIPGAHPLWLDPTVRDVERLQAVLRPYADDEMVAYPVGAQVSNPANDSADTIAPSLVDHKVSPLPRATGANGKWMR